MLDKHLIASTDPVAKEESIVFWKQYRITILFDELFRIEKSENHVFNDQATQIVWFRNKKTPKYEILEQEECLKIKTRKVTLVLIDSNSIEDSFVIIKGKEVHLDNKENLKGTARTLDCYDGEYLTNYKEDGPRSKIILDNGVASKNGVAVIDDSHSLLLNKEGSLEKAPKGHQDYYVFAYGHNYREAVKALFEITGYAPILPRYAFGNWWSRYHDYTDKEYMTLLYKFIDRDVPITVSTIDMDWHYNSRNLDAAKHISELGRDTPFYGGKDGWTGYTWNKDLFKNYKQFLKDITDLGFHITLNLHPACGVRWFEDCYKDFAIAMGKDPNKGEQIPFDFTDDNFINNYFKIIHKPYENDGVSFYWIDWQQGTNSKMPGLDPLWALNHYHYLDNSLNHEHGLILSRYSGIGSHRYPIGFSGDTVSSWDTMNYISEFTSKSTNVGYTYWSHDIGGHYGGRLEYQLYTRFLQFGVFSPINRLHSSDMPIISKEPWYYLNGAGDIAIDFLRLRHKLIPYLYSSCYKTHLKGLGLIEPLYYSLGNVKKGYEYPNEYIFAQDGFIVPATHPLNKDGYTIEKGYLPKGRYFDFFTHDIYELKKNKEIKFARTLENFPYLVKAGSFIPLSMDKIQYNEVENPTTLNLVTSKGDNKYTLYEDKGKTVSKTLFENQLLNENTLQLSIRFDKADKVFDKKRTFVFDYVDLKNANIKVFINGEESNDFKIRYAENLRFELPVDNKSKYVVEISFEKEDRFEEIKENLKRILYSIDTQSKNKYVVYDQILKDPTNLYELIQAIKSSKVLNKSEKVRLLEIC